MPSTVNRAAFINSLRTALNNLYDPYELQRNPLQFILAGQTTESGIDVKQILINAINALMPDERTPYQTKAWKVYELLSYRFIDQLEQKETARTLLVSLRTLQRLSPEAVEILAEKIAADFHITLTTTENEMAGSDKAHDEATSQNDTWSNETSALKTRNKNSSTDNRQLIKEIADILRPINSQGQNQVRINHPEESWFIPGQITFLRQAVLTAVSSFQRAKTGLDIVISTSREGSQGIVTISGKGLIPDVNEIGPFIHPDAVNIITKLMADVNGTAEVDLPTPSQAVIILKLPVVNRLNILMVDDNADAIKLAGRYLDQSLFTLTGIQDPEQVMPEINKNKPFLIILDIMLPNIDGWMLLGQIRRNPVSAAIPVIVSTILPQEDLAVSLGANGFIRKPYTQEQLLSVLEDYMLMNPR